MEIQRESGIQSFASWHGYPTSSLAVWVMWNSLVPQRRNQVRYVTVTKMRGYSCTAEVPVVSVSAVVEDFPPAWSAWMSAGPAVVPSGVVTFRFTDVEGSTRGTSIGIR